MRRAAAIASLVAAAVAGCDSGADDERRKPGPGPRERAASHERSVRGWSRALNAEQYERAADYFLRGVIIDQGREIQLITRAQLLHFNRSLPCKADVTRVVEERRATLAYFRLKRGPGGPCHGRVRVRFTIHGGKFSQFRQLPEPPPPPGDPA
jgi:hypothetical protein